MQARSPGHTGGGGGGPGGAGNDAFVALEIQPALGAHCMEGVSWPTQQLCGSVSLLQPEGGHHCHRFISAAQAAAWHAAADV